jgi:hypothetical protein
MAPPPAPRTATASSTATTTATTAAALATLAAAVFAASTTAATSSSTTAAAGTVTALGALGLTFPSPSHDWGGRRRRYDFHARPEIRIDFDDADLGDLGGGLTRPSPARAAPESSAALRDSTSRARPLAVGWRRRGRGGHWDIVFFFEVGRRRLEHGSRRFGLLGFGLWLRGLLRLLFVDADSAHRISQAAECIAE